MCEKCGFIVTGNGYTNHCPECLWSKHVDVYPGDRLAECGGLMEPVLVEKVRGQYSVVHKCVICTRQKPNKVAPEDNFDVVVKISAQNSR